jgi:hypothetical protein
MKIIVNDIKFKYTYNKFGRIFIRQGKKPFYVGIVEKRQSPSTIQFLIETLLDEREKLNNIDKKPIFEKRIVKKKSDIIFNKNNMY